MGYSAYIELCITIFFVGIGLKTGALKGNKSFFEQMQEYKKEHDVLKEELEEL